MRIAFRTAALVTLCLALAGCEPFASTRAYSGPDSVIATGLDQGFDSGVLQSGEAAIAYDPDGCQNWIIDDGVEGYSSPRYDPRTGLPVCDGRYPPGTVIRPYQTESAGVGDRVSGPGIRTVVRQ
jgi:hypothetical protein